MRSSTAMNKHSGVLRIIEQVKVKRSWSYKGMVDNTIYDILGGLRSTCTYVGADKLKHLPKRTTFGKSSTTQ